MMELKCEAQAGDIYGRGSFNRTMMELKSGK